MLVGRTTEQEALNRLLESAREERGAALVVRGEPGIGKTALLDYAEQQAAGMRVLRCVGIEAEHELAFAGMHQLVLPCLDLIDRLPPPQADAVRTALGLAEGVVGNRFLVALGLLSLLAEASDEAPVLCCVDDAQWLDGPSAEALVFVARRLQAERIAVLMTVREGDPQRFPAPGVPEIELGALGASESRALLTARLGDGVSPGVLATLLDDASGNPLALLELPAALSRQQLRGAEPILGPPPVRPAVEWTFRTRVAALPERTRRMLLIAAADEVGDLAAIVGAGRRLGLDPVDLDDAERDGLVQVDGGVRFRHPLVRSAIYRSAGRESRRVAHEALAAVVGDPVRSAWHRAVVADGADEGIASDLEAAGSQAAARGALATASVAFERAAKLSEDTRRLGRRLTRAAVAAFDAGRADAALSLVERARPFAGDPLDQALLERLRASDAARRGSPAECQILLADAADAVLHDAPEDAAELLLWSMVTALASGRIDGAVERGRRTLPRLDTSGPRGGLARAVIEAMSALLAQDVPVAVARLDEASDRVRRVALPLRIMEAFIGTWRGDYARARRVTETAIAAARREGGLASLAGSFPLLVVSQIGEGRLPAAAATITEGVELAGRLGFENDESALLSLQARIAAQQGREQECRALAERAMRRTLAIGVGWATEQARLAVAELELGLGNPAEAIDQLEQLDQGPLPPTALLASGDLIDAALRVGDADRARSALAAFEAWAPVSDAPLVRGLLARCRALLAGDPAEAERRFEEAVDHHSRDAPAYERARSRLAYGEWLRRERRRTAARVQLREALQTFEGLRARLWAERARSELDATGEKARRRDVSTLDELTPQELRIAQLVAEGASNGDVAAQLFLSRKTVEYHLRKVFLKLGIASRVELARASLGEARIGTG